MEETKKLSHEEVKDTIAQIYKDMEETLKDLENINIDETAAMTEDREEDAKTPEEPIAAEEASEHEKTTVYEDQAAEDDMAIEEQMPPNERVETFEAPEDLYEEGEPPADVSPVVAEKGEIIENMFEDEQIPPQAVNDEVSPINVVRDSIFGDMPAEGCLNKDILDMVQEFKREISRVVIGYDDIVENLLIALLARGHVLLEGVPGIAKTTLAKTFTSTLGMECQRIQFTPDMLPQDITGHFFYNQMAHEFELRKGPIFSNLLLADEINRTTPKTQSALLESMEEKQVTIEGKTFVLPQPFMVIATINPIEHDGVYQLPMAQADRFMLKVNMGYISKERELELLRMKANGKRTSHAPPKVFDLERLEEAYDNVFVDESIIEYINEIIASTRNSRLITIGASPRASEQLLYAARAKACIRGRDYIIPDDVKDVVYDTLNHRLLPSPDLDPEEGSIGGVINNILENIKVPLEKR